MASPSIVVFNEAYYLAQNPDVAAAVTSGVFATGLAHWQAYGQSEGRPSSAFFDLQTYKDNNGDLTADAGFVTDADYIRHFTTYGYAEQRVFLSATVFNADIYAAQNPDLAAAGITDRLALEQHFLRSGIYEGRITKAGFDPVAYINANADLKALLDAGGNINGYTSANIAKAGWFHYLNFGISEGRTVPAPNPTVTIAAGASTVTEGNGATFTVTLSIPLTTDTTYTFNVTGDTKNGALNAASATDFGSVTGTVTISAGSTTGTFTVTPSADGVSEGLEGFKVTLFDGSLNVIKTSDVIGIIDAAAPVTPKTITLTTAADAGTAFIGDTANDTFIGAFNLGASATDTATTTLTAGDSLVGGAGTDTLSISVAGGAGAGSVTPTLIGIEKISIASSHTGAATFDLSLADSSLSSISVTSSVTASSDLNFTNVGSIVALDVKGVGDVDLTFATAATSGTGDAMSLTLNGVGTSGTSSVISANGIETLNVTSAGAANYLTLGTGFAAGTKTVNVSGSQAATINLGGATSAVTAVNASGLTSALTLSGVGTGKVTVTGGAGNDTFDFSTGFDATLVTGTGAAQNDVIAGGAGNDTLKIDATAVVGDALFGNVSSVEVLNLTGTSGVTLDAKALAAGIGTVIEASAGQISLTVGTGYTGGLIVALTSTTGTDSVVVNASGSASLTVSAVLSDNLGLTGTTITAGTGTGQTNDVLSLTASGTGTIASTLSSTITGIDKITVGATGGATGLTLTTNNANVASGGTLTVDASALGTGTTLTLSGGAETDGKFSITGGAAADTIIAGSGNDTVFGGAGNDSIDASSGGNDVLSGGAGNDTFNLSGNLTSGDVIDGGDGTDTLVLSSATVSSAMLTGVTNVENLVFSGDATLNAPIQFSSFDLSLATAAGVLTLASGYTGATTVTLGGSGDSVVNTANVALTVNVTDVNYSTNTGLLIAGGTGTDTLNLTGAATTISGAPNVVTLNASSNIEVINIVDAGDATGTGATGAGKDVSLALATGYTKAVTVDASSLDSGSSGLDETFTFDASLSSGTVTVTGGAANDSITGSSGNDVLNGGAGADSLVAGSGFDNLNGGDGNDTLVFSTFFDGNDTVNGGSGTDTLSIDQGTGGLGDLAFLNVTNTERLSLANAVGTVTLDTRALAAGLTTVVLAAGTSGVVVNAGGYSSGITFLASSNSGNVSLTGGAGNDTFTFSGGGTGTGTIILDSGDVLVGGSGVDTIVFGNGAGTSGSGEAVRGILGSGVVGIESITIGDNATGTGSVGAVTLTLNAGFNSGVGVSVDASALNGTGETFTFTNAGTGSVTVTGGAAADVIAGGSAADSIVAGSGADNVDGGAGNDVIDGGAGADTITGGAGADTLTGGAGNDVFVVSSGSSTSTGADVITDWASGDVARLDLSYTTGTISIDNTYKGAAASYSDALSLLTGQTGTNLGQYVYVSSSNQLVVDVDGNGLLQGNDLYLTLSGTTGITAAAVALNVTISDAAAGSIIGGTSAVDTVTQTGANVGALTVSGVEFYVGGAGTTAALTLSGTTAISISDTAGLNVSGATGADTITVTSAVATHTYTLNEGADTITFSGAVTSATVTAGDGTDTITFVSTGGNTATIHGVESVVGSAGVDTLTLTSGSVTIDGGSGADVLTFGATGLTGTITNVEAVSGSAGVDTVVLSNTGSDVVLLGAGTGTGTTVTFTNWGTGADVINLGTSGGADTVVFGTGFSASGITGLVISNFDAGASADVLNFADIVVGTTIATTGAAYNLGATTAADLAVGSNGVVLTYGSLTLANTDFTVTSGSNTDIFVGNNDPFIVFATADLTSTVVNVYLVDRDLDTNAADVSANDIRLIGTINLVTGDNINTFASTNFGL